MSKLKTNQNKSQISGNEKPKGVNTGSTQAKILTKSYNFRYDGLLSIVIPIQKNDHKQLFSQLLQFAQIWKSPYQVILTKASGTVDFINLESEILNLKTENAAYVFVNTNANSRGLAIKAAIEKIEGDHVLLADGQWGTNLAQLAQWAQDAGDKGFPSDSIWLGSRRLNSNQSKNLGNAPYFYNIGIQLFTSLNLSDTQGNFTMMPANFAKHLYQSAGSATDSEILYLADLYDIKIEEKSLDWSRPEGELSGPGEILKKTFELFKTRLNGKFRFFFVNPFRELKSDALFQQKESPLFRFFFAFGSIFLLFLMAWMSFDYGITGDEVLQKNYGDDVLAYFETDGKNKKCLEWELLSYYGGFFDYIASWCNKYIGVLDPYDMRHLINSVFGFTVIYWAARIGKFLTGSWRVSLLTLVFLTLSPRLFGDSMNNPKDIPFASGYIISLYYLLQLTKQLPKPSFKSILMLTIGIGLTISARSGGILLLPYMGMFMAAAVLFRADLQPILFKFQLNKILSLAFIFVGISLLGYLAGTLYWPYAQLDIIKNPINALTKLTNFPVGIRTQWEGRPLWSDELPWYYIPKWILMSSPLVVLFGFPLSISFLFHKDYKNKWLYIGLAFFTTLFPVSYAIYKQSSLYDGWRHFLFVYPMIGIMAAFGWILMADYIKNKVGSIAVAIIVGVLTFFPLRWMIESHPHQYVYFNEIFGGVKNAYGRYETDYYMNSMRRLSEWLIENEPKIKKGEEVVVATNCVEPVKYYMSKYPNVKMRYVRYHERIKTDYDYLITYSRFINWGFLKNGAWPPGNVVYTEKVAGVPLGTVTKTSDRNMRGVRADSAFKAKDFETGFNLLKEVLKEDPKNESALLQMAQSYAQVQQFDKMKEVLDKALALDDTYVNALSLLGVYYLNKNMQDSAKNVFEKIIFHNYKFSFAYFHLANIAVQNKDNKKALDYLWKFDENGGQPSQGYDIAISIAQQNNDRKLQLYFQARKFAAENKAQEAFNLLNQVLGIDPKFAPAVKMKLAYEEAMREQEIKRQNQQYLNQNSGKQ
jgi:tetratricopeptide (TPR) repeat protein